jgi:Zn-dependent peptidase ImmA (M78 family)
VGTHHRQQRQHRDIVRRWQAGTPVSGRTRAAAETAAATLLTDAGVTEIPVPVENLAGRCGAIVRYQPFDGDDVSGLLYRQPEQPPVIGVNSTNNAVRQRFTIAHELGHLRLHKGHQLILDRLVRVNFRDAASSTAADWEEMQANAFAAALLMPADAIETRLHRLIRGQALSDQELIARLARDFQVSRPAMEFRLINLGLHTPG